MPEPRQQEQIHYVTGEPMAPCPKCGHLSGLSGIDGGLCLACMMDWPKAIDVVNEQAEDEGLWFVAKTMPEAYLQQELRRLHAAVEAGDPGA